MKINKPEIFFVILILIFGTLLVFITPIGAGADEDTHVARIWEMSTGALLPNQLLGTGPNFPYTFYQLSYRQDINVKPVSWEAWQTLASEKIDWNSMIKYITRARYFPTLYLPQAFIMGIMGRVFDMPVYLIYYVERLSYLFIYALLVYLAIRITPVGKWVFGILSVTPMSLIIASIVSPDGFNNGIAFVFIAWVLNLNRPAKKSSFSRKDWFITALLTLAICTLKLNSIPLLLILFLIPRIKFGTRKWLVAFIVFALASIALVGLGWNFLTSSQLIFSATEETYNAGDQLKGILADPLHFLSAVGNNILTMTPKYLHDLVGISGYTYWNLPEPVYWITPILVLIAFLSQGMEGLLDLRKRILLGSTFVIIFLGTITLFYLLYNAPGTIQISGVQGRYFIFAGPLVMIALLPKKAVLNLKSTWLQAGTVLIALLSVGGLFLAYHVTCGSAYYSTGLCYLPRYKNWSPTTSLPVKIAPANPISQSFTSDCSDLTQVRLMVKAKGTSLDPVSITLKTGDTTVVSRVFPQSDIPSSGWLNLDFPPISDSKNTAYVLEAGPADNLGQPEIDLGASSRDEYLAGSLSINHQNQNGDLLFQYGCSVGLDKVFNLSSR